MLDGENIKAINTGEIVENGKYINPCDPFLAEHVRDADDAIRIIQAGLLGAISAVEDAKKR